MIPASGSSYRGREISGYVCGKFDDLMKNSVAVVMVSLCHLVHNVFRVAFLVFQKNKIKFPCV
jgi:hypothetical protein